MSDGDVLKKYYVHSKKNLNVSINYILRDRKKMQLENNMTKLKTK